MCKVKETVADDQKAIQVSAMKNNFQNQEKCEVCVLCSLLFSGAVCYGPSVVSTDLQQIT